MNLAVRDIRHNIVRFVLTAVGIGLLLMLVMGMGGIYRGLVQDATLLLESISADLWVVEKDTRGPFAEESRVPANLEDRVRVVPGVESARSFVSTVVQHERNGEPLRIALQGLSWPEDRGDWLPITAGRALRRSHFELIADEMLGLRLGEELRLGKDTYTIVGLTRSMVSLGGDGLAFVTSRDAQAIRSEMPAEATRIERASRFGRAERSDLAHTQPDIVEKTLGPSSTVPAGGTAMVSAIAVRVRAGADVARVASAISAWPDVSVLTHEQEEHLLLRGTVDRARQQLGLFRILLVTVSAIIMALILYTLTLDKVHDIAMLKLMGARNRVILGLILQQALILGAAGLAIAYCVGSQVFPRFPRRVVIVDADLISLAVSVVIISVASSALGIARALRVEANQVLS